MLDLADIAVLAFADEGAACLVVAAFASLLVTTKLRPLRVTMAAFLACWAYPLLALWSAYDRAVAIEAAGHAVAGLPGEAVWLAVRFGGMLGVITLLWRARLALHGRKAKVTVEARA